jgi:hypothetical protein
MQDNYKNRIHDKFSWYHSVQYCLPVGCVRIMIKINRNVVFRFSIWVSHWIFHIDGRIQVSENTVLKKVFGSKEDQLTDDY